METKTAFGKFAPAKVYHRDNKEALWAAVMAPFLANQLSCLGWDTSELMLGFSRL